MPGFLDRILLPASISDPADTTAPAVVVDADVEPHAHENAAVAQAFGAPSQHEVAQQQHGGPGAIRAVPVILTGTTATRPQPAPVWGPGTVVVPDANAGPAVGVLGRDIYRRGALIVNIGTQNVYLAPQRGQCQAGSPSVFTLLPGASYSHDSSAPVWAISTAGGGGGLLTFAFTADPADS
jgi:hypothetical protein